jgi:mRNA interferase RelE/StbE
MTILLLKPFPRQYRKLPKLVQKKVDRQLQLLAQDIRHPSLRARKMQNTEHIWECRVDYHYRMTFKFIDNTIILRSVGTHEIYRNVA